MKSGVTTALILTAAVLGTAHAATLRLDTVAGAPDVVMPVYLSSVAGQAVAAIQFEVVFSAFRFVSAAVTAGPAAIAAGKDVSASTPAPGRVRCIVAGLNRDAIPDGVVVNVTLSFAGGAPAGSYLIRLENVVLAGPDAESLPATVFNGVALAGPVHRHSADVNTDWRISISELLRVIQLYNSREYHCDGDSEDGFAGGPGQRECSPHDSDYGVSQNWKVGISELLRLIQLYNLGGYHVDTGAEDGFAPGPVTLE